MNKISIARSEGYSPRAIYAAVERSLDALNSTDIFNSKSIIIKPNLCYYWDYTTGQTTDPRVVSSIIDLIREKSTVDVDICIAEADASAMKTKYAFKMLGYEKLSKEKKINLINLSEGEIIKKEVVVKDEKFVLPINTILMNTDLIINVPTLKTHRTVGFTCALKNMFGAISKPRKFSYHNKLSEVIVAINKILKSNLVIVDGIVVSGKLPKKMGLIISSNNFLALDMFIADMIGYGSNKISYLKLAKEEKIYDTSSPEIISDESDLTYFKNEFPKYNYWVEDKTWKLLLFMLRLYTRIVGDVLPPVLEIN